MITGIASGMALHKIKFGNMYLAGIVVKHDLPDNKVWVKTALMELAVPAEDLVDVYPEGAFNNLETKLFDGAHSQILSNKQYYTPDHERF